MFSSSLRAVPWRNREAWLRVYEDAYSEETERQIKACQTMSLWLVLRNDVPPGVECTLDILSALCQDTQGQPRQMQLILSTAVLRVVNMLCDNARQSNKETIYSIARDYNIPNWIVNLRHDVSHGSSLPDLSSLKRAATFLLSWLKEYYWEVEKDGLRNIVLKRSRFDACKENVNFFMTLYIELSQLLEEYGDINCKKIKNHDLKLKLFDMSNKRGFNCVIECIPWVNHSKDAFAKELLNSDVSKMKVSKLINTVLLFLQDYVVKFALWEVDSLPFIIQFLSSHKYRGGFWDPLIQKLNDWQALGRTLKILSSEENLKDENLLHWFSYICKSLVKRNKYDKLRYKLSLSAQLSQDIDEQVFLSKAMLKKRLSLPSDAGEKDVINKLFTSVEKKHSDLKDSIRLMSPINYIIESCLVVNIIKLLALSPTKQSLSKLPYLFELGNPEFPQSKMTELCDLMLTRIGQKSSHKLSLSSTQVKTLADLPNGEVHLNELLNKHCQAKREPERMESDVQTNSAITRSGWNFSRCPLGTTPWDEEGVSYYHKPLNSESSPSYVFPVSKRPRLNI